MESKGRELHAKAEHAREGGEFGEALKHLVDALQAYVQEGDLLGFAEGLQSQTLTLRHLYEKTGFKPYLHYALHSAMAGAGAAEEKGDKSALVIPYHTVGKTYETMGNYGQAVVWHQKAVEIVDELPERHNREGYKAEVMGHLYSSQMMTGDESAYEKLMGQIKRLEESDEAKYTKDVWLSGMYMSAAQGLGHLDQKERAKEHITRAETIISANPDLRLRAEQLKKLKSELGL